jgi:hypothetical protein
MSLALSHYLGRSRTHTIVEMHGRVAPVRNAALCLIPIVISALPLGKRAGDGSNDCDQGIAVAAVLDEHAVKRSGRQQLRQKLVERPRRVWSRRWRWHGGECRSTPAQRSFRQQTQRQTQTQQAPRQPGHGEGQGGKEQCAAPLFGCR